MKNIKKFLSCLLAIFILLSILSVSAADIEITNIKKSITGDYMKISGIAEGKPGAEVFMRIVYPDTEVSTQTQELADIVAFQEQTKADVDGKFVFTIQLDYNEKPYSIRIGVMGSDSDYNEDFIFYGGDYRIIARNEINQIKQDGTSTSIMDTVAKYYENLYLDSSLYDEYLMSGSDISKLGEIMQKSNKLDDVAELADQLNAAVIISAFKSAKTDKELLELLEKYSDYIDICNLSAYQTLLSIGSLKSSVLNSFKAAEYYTIEETEDTFSFIVISEALKNAIGGDAVKKILTQNSKILGIEMSDYKLTDKQFSDISGMEIDNLSDIKTKLDTLKENKKQNDTSGGGSSSGGSGAGVVVMKPKAQQVNQPEDKALPFTDMAKHSWAEEGIKALYNKGIINGESEKTFAPDRNVTREEFVKILIEGFDDNTLSYADKNLSDVSKNEWYYPYIAKALSAGIVSGKADGSFGIGEPITRQDMAVMLFRAIEYFYPDAAIKGTSIEKFIDFQQINEYAHDAVGFVSHCNIAQGMGDGRFAPFDTATRAQSAVIVYRALKYVEGKNIQ